MQTSIEASDIDIEALSRPTSSSYTRKHCTNLLVGIKQRIHEGLSSFRQTAHRSKSMGDKPQLPNAKLFAV